MTETTPPAGDDVREALVSLIWGDADAIESLSVEEAADRVVAAGFRPHGKITDDQVKAAADAICRSAEGEPLSDVRMALRSQYMREARAALEAAREA